MWVFRWQKPQRAQKSLASSSLARVPVITDYLLKYMYVEKNNVRYWRQSLTTDACERWAEQKLSGADRNRVSESGTVREHSRKRVSRSGMWRGRPQSGSRRASGCHNNRLKRWAANRPPLTLRSHALLTTAKYIICVIMCDAVYDWHLVVFATWHSYEDSGFVVIDITGVGVLDVEVGAGAITCAVEWTVLWWRRWLRLVCHVQRTRHRSVLGLPRLVEGRHLERVHQWRHWDNHSQQQQQHWSDNLLHLRAYQIDQKCPKLSQIRDRTGSERLTRWPDPVS